LAKDTLQRGNRWFKDMSQVGLSELLKKSRASQKILMQRCRTWTELKNKRIGFKRIGAMMKLIWKKKEYGACVEYGTGLCIGSVYN